jgi:hypothetical protein
LNDLDTKTYETELDLWANSIKEEVNLLSCRKIEEEARENSRFRALSNKFSDTTPSHYKNLKIKLRLLEFCSTYNYETTWKQTRKIGNTTLFSKSVRYQRWRARQDSCTLIYTGKLGSGKSVLLANIVDDLNGYYQDKNSTVTYFFCRHDFAQSLKAGTIIGSLVRQLLHPIPDLSMAEKFLDKTTQLDFEKLFLFLGSEQVLPTNFKAYFILDGIDECDGSEREELITQLQKFQQIFPLLLCLSTSMRLDDNSDLRLENFRAPNIISMPDNNPDIENFINAESAACKTENYLSETPHLYWKYKLL